MGCRYDNPFAGCGDGNEPQELKEALFGKGSRVANLSLAPEKPVFNSGDFVLVRPYRMITRGLNGAVLISECRVIGVRGVVERVCSERKTRQSSLLVWMYRRFDFIEDIWPEQK